MPVTKSSAQQNRIQRHYLKNHISLNRLAYLNYVPLKHPRLDWVEISRKYFFQRTQFVFGVSQTTEAERADEVIFSEILSNCDSTPTSRF